MEHLIGNKEATFFVRAQGNSMIGTGIYDGDLLVVDKSNTPTSGKIVIAIIYGDLPVSVLSCGQQDPSQTRKSTFQGDRTSSWTGTARLRGRNLDHQAIYLT